MIYINGIPSFRAPEKEVTIPDDRQEKIELINSVVVQDLGRVEEGDVISLQCLFRADKFEELKAIWTARTLVPYTDEAGVTIGNVRVKITEWERDRHFPNYILATFELWRA